MTEEQRQLEKIREYVLGTMSIDYDFMDHDYELEITIGDVANYLTYVTNHYEIAALKQTFKEEKFISNLVYYFDYLFTPLIESDDDFKDFIKEWYEEDATESWEAEKDERFESYCEESHRGV